MSVQELACPVCQTPVRWTEEFEHRPFCSRRCKDSDFCAWSNEELVIPGSITENDYLSESEYLLTPVRRTD